MIKFLPPLVVKSEDIVTESGIKLCMLKRSGKMIVRTSSCVHQSEHAKVSSGDHCGVPLFAYILNDLSAEALAVFSAQLGAIAIEQVQEHTAKRSLSMQIIIGTLEVISPASVRVIAGFAFKLDGD
jgi:hypothetical protein